MIKIGINPEEGIKITSGKKIKKFFFPMISNLIIF